MIRSMRRIRILPVLAAAAMLAAVLAAGCGKEPRTAVGRLDTPEHHTLRGHDFIDKGDWAEAGRSFDAAISLGKDYGPAYAGKAVVVAHEADNHTVSADQREDIFDRAEKLLNQAHQNAKNDDQERAAYTATIRVQRLTKASDGWLNDAQKAYELAVKVDSRVPDPDPHFFMARAYRDAFQLQQSQDLYRKVLSLNSGRSQMADSELALLQKIIRAEPGSRHGRTVAFDSSITRADIAALFLEELRLDRLYLRGGQQQADTRFRPPAGQQQFQADRVVKAPEATDVDTHPLAGDIREVIQLRVAGLQPDASHLFHPNATVVRGEYAMMVEDILVKVTGEQGLRTRFIGQASPFRDVRSDVPWFNAIQTVTSRSLMEPADKVNGIFKPGEPITGADALLVIRLLRDELRSYVR